MRALASLLLPAVLLTVGCDDKDTDTTATTDADGDGFDGIDSGGDDCDDSDATVNPDAQEVCDGIDNNCDDKIDDDDSSVDLTTGSTWYTDTDGDGYGNPDVSLDACDQPSGRVAEGTDCNDADDTVYPGAEELCEGIYNDCDDPDFDADGTPPEESDEDGDGYVECVDWQGDATVSGGNDCDDTKTSINPDATEVCDGIDNNCDGATDDETAVDATTFYADTDGDGYGDTKSPLNSCEAPKGYSDLDGDCDDADGTISPGADEIPLNGIDDDCDGFDGCEDFNCDGYTDAFFGSLYSGSYGQTFAGDGASMTPETSLTSCSNYDSAHGDINGDGYVDLVTANYSCSSSYNNIFYGSATGPTDASSDYLTHAYGIEVEVEDFNLDGYDDVVFSSYSSGTAYIHWGSAKGATTSTALTVQTGWDLAVGDANQDGYKDILFCSTSYSGSSYLYYGSSTGFSSSSYDTLASGYAYGCEMEDLNGDGYPEAILSGSSSSYPHYVYWGDAAGYSTSNRTSLTASTTTYGITTGDYDADGHVDIFFSSWGYSDSYLYYGSSTGYSDSDRASIGSEYTFRPLTADLNGDGYDDLFIPSYYGNAEVYLGSSSGLGSSADYTLDSVYAYNAAATDLDGDGYWELFLPGYSGYDSKLYWGSASGWSTGNADTLSTYYVFGAPSLITSDKTARSQ